MNLPEIMPTTGTIVAGLLTLAVLSYAFGSSPWSRVAEYLFVGVSAGYLLVVAYHSVLLSRVVDPLTASPATSWPLLIPIALGLLLFTGGWRPIRWLANWPIALMIGVAVGLELLGSLGGTLIPQTEAAIPSSVTDGAGIFALTCTVVALVAFGYATLHGNAKGWPRRIAVSGGQWVVLFALGALFAGLATSEIALLVGRVSFLSHDWLQAVRHVF